MVGELSSQLIANMANMQGSSGGAGPSGGGQSPLMQHLQSGYLCGVVPLKIRISCGIEQIGGFKGINSPICQMANQVTNTGSSFLPASIWEELKQFLKGGLEDYAGGLSDAFAALAAVSMDRNFDGAMASMANMRMQSLPNGMPDQFDSAHMIV